MPNGEYCPVRQMTVVEPSENGTEITKRLRLPTMSAEADVSSVENGQLIPISSYHSHPTDESWRTHPIEAFLSQLSDRSHERKEISKAVRAFYKKQDAHIHELEKLTDLENIEDESTTEEPILNNPDKVHFRGQVSNTVIMRVVFFANLTLLIGKAVASSISGSLSIISSLLDSCVDLASGGIMWYTSRQMRKRRPYSYPQGRTRFEPVAVIILAVFMATISLQLMIESIEAIVRMSKNERPPPNVDNLTLGIMAGVILTKVGLWVVCVKFGRSAAVRALTVDQRNDVFSNLVSLLFSGIAGRLPPLLKDERFRNLKYLDPVGAILIGFYILYSWYQIGAEQTRNLAGHTADPRFIQKIAFVSLNHHAAIERLDTIRAFHFGSHFLVEVDIVLPMGMRLKEAHDIGETLQKKLERVEHVERAFVHLDYEFSHHPESEHKIAN
ncbi:hypothetical protein CRM22_003427 [Opisthorchis felineus]|uniref:Uncharacterized protein n=2 Tax=Opisthorchis felineus TaxID=147828 RepID=A0A4S2M675_OPIFE|nr:hypothetical protein CRM22_003427 [Opisthorchis felineus]